MLGTQNKTEVVPDVPVHLCACVLTAYYNKVIGALVQNEGDHTVGAPNPDWGGSGKSYRKGIRGKPGGRISRFGEKSALGGNTGVVSSWRVRAAVAVNERARAKERESERAREREGEGSNCEGPQATPGLLPRDLIYPRPRRRFGHSESLAGAHHPAATRSHTLASPSRGGRDSAPQGRLLPPPRDCAGRARPAR